MAASTAGTPTVQRLTDAAGLDRATVGAYDDLFDTMSLTQRVPADANNRLNRLARLPKRYLTEPALLGPLAGIDVRAVLRDVDVARQGHRHLRHR